MAAADPKSAAPAVRIEKSEDGQVWTVILSRAAVRNAVDRPTAEALTDAFRQFDTDDIARVAVLYGDGGNFCAGADLKALSRGEEASMNQVAPVGEADGPMGPTRMMLTKPVIAAISGYAVAGGLELALWCDMRVAEEDAELGVFCRRFGVPLIDGGTVRLPRLIGLSNALDLILTGRAVEADEALRMGLINRIVPKGCVREEAEALAATLAKFPQECLRHDRLSAYESLDVPLRAGLENEYRHGLISLATESSDGAKTFLSGIGRHGTFKDVTDGSASKRSYHTSARALAPAVERPPISAVLFDLGGVLLPSPLPHIAAYEKAVGVAPGTVGSVIAGTGSMGSFAKLERGEISLQEFGRLFQTECRAAGAAAINGTEIARLISGAGFLSSIASASDPETALIANVRPLFLEAIDSIRDKGIKTGIITNNFRGDGTDELIDRVFSSRMDVIVQSCRVGMRKPDPRIFEHACERLRVPPRQAVFLDDLGTNLKAARALGMQTIRVNLDDTHAAAAIRDLERTLGFRLLRAVQRSLPVLRARL